MRTPLFIALLVVNLLMCPLRCFPCQAEVTCDESVAAASCSCCHHDAQAGPAPTSDLDSKHGDSSPCGGDCNCKNCICEGAVLESDMDLPDPSLVVGWAHVVDARSMLPSFSDAALGSHRDLPSCASRSGRQVRLAHQSWLI